MQLVKLLEPELAVSPIEHVTPTCGRRKILRTQRNSLRSYTEIKQSGHLDERTKLLLPVLFEQADDFMNEMEQETRESLDGVMLFGG